MLPSQEEIQAALSEIHAQLADASRAAFNHWLRIPPAQRAALDHPRTYANAIWGFFRAEAIVRFSAMPGVELTHRYNTLGIVVRNRVHLRFKRINRLGRSRNNATPTNLAFYSQIELPGIPASCPRVELGWREDALRLNLDALEIVMRQGNAILWRYSILEVGEAEVRPMTELASNTHAHVRKSQVRRKREKKTGSHDQ